MSDIIVGKKRYTIDAGIIVTIYLFLGPLESLHMASLSRCFAEATRYIWDDALTIPALQMSTLVRPSVIMSKPLLKRQLIIRAFKASVLASQHSSAIESADVTSAGFGTPKSFLHPPTSVGGDIIILGGSRNLATTNSCLAFEDRIYVTGNRSNEEVEEKRCLVSGSSISSDSATASRGFSRNTLNSNASPTSINSRASTSLRIEHVPMTGRGMLPSRSAMGVTCDHARVIVALGGWDGSNAVDTVYILDHLKFSRHTTMLARMSQEELCVYREQQRQAMLQRHGCAETSTGMAATGNDTETSVVDATTTATAATATAVATVLMTAGNGSEEEEDDDDWATVTETESDTDSSSSDMTNEEDGGSFSGLSPSLDDSDVQDGPGGWRLRHPLPRPLAYCSAAMDSSGDVYVTGGADGLYQDATVFTECYKQSYTSITGMKATETETDAVMSTDTDGGINETADVWKSIAPMRVQRCGHASVALPSSCVDGKGNESGSGSCGMHSGSVIAAVGGYSGGMIYQDTIEFYNPVVDCWTLASNRMKYRRSGLAAAVGDAGCISSQYETDNGFLAKEKEEEEEEEKEDEDFCHARRHHPTCIGTNSDDNATNVASTSTVTNARARAGAGAGNSIYVVGGSSDGFKGLKQCEHYDLRSGKWHSLANMKVARGYTAACFGGTASPYLLYVSGGVDGHNYCNSIEVYDTRMNSWWLVSDNKVHTAATRFINEQNQPMISSHVLHNHNHNHNYNYNRQSISVSDMSMGDSGSSSNPSQQQQVQQVHQPPKYHWPFSERDNLSRADHAMVFMMR